MPNHHGVFSYLRSEAWENTLNFWCFIFSRDSHLQKLQRLTIQQVGFCQLVICSYIDRTEKHEAHEVTHVTSQNTNNQQSTVQGGMKFKN